MSKKLDKFLDQLINLHPKYIDLSLKRLSKLLKKLKNPHLNLPPVIHIAGTNGKGSILSYIRHILIENNLIIHSYISPHLKNFNERITLANKVIETKELLKNLNYVKKINEDDPITFFEITTATAFYLFSNKKADLLLLETGLGGRLDATNVIIQSLVDIISPISIDHQEYLGKNLLKIADEKLGIIKKNSNIIISNQNKLVKLHIKNRLGKLPNKKLFYDKDFKILDKNKKTFTLQYKKKLYKFHNPKLLGDHQIENASTAIATILRLNEMDFNFSNKVINQGISKTKWPGRLEKGELENIPVYLDGAHNVDGAQQILKYFNNQQIKVWVIIGMLNNKNLNGFLKMLKPIIQGLIAIPIPLEKNSFNTEVIIKNCNKLKILSYSKSSIKEANNFLLSKIKPKIILISGSLYLIGKVRNLYL